MESYVGYSHYSCSDPHRYVHPKFKETAMAKAEVDKSEVEALVKKATLIFANSIPHDKFLSSSASVVELNITDNGIEAIVNTEQTFVLDYNTPYDEPYLKGMMQKLRDDKSISSVEEVSMLTNI